MFVLFAMWYAASSQNNAAAYLLFFTLSSLFIVSIPHALLNVASLQATTESVKPTFAGDEVSLPVEVTNQSAKPRYGVRVQVADSGGDEQAVDAIAAGKAARVLIRFPAGGRQRIRLQTREDGLSIDQVVLSAEKYLTSRPGAAKNDATVLSRTTP